MCNIWIYNHLLSRMQHLPSAGVAKKGTCESVNLTPGFGERELANL